jgi:hypothetical protein
MKQVKKITKEDVWLGCIAVGPITAYLAIFYPGLSIIAVIFTIIGIKGILTHVM